MTAADGSRFDLQRLWRHWGFFSVLAPSIFIMAAQLALWVINADASQDNLTTILAKYAEIPTIPAVLAGGRLEWMTLILGGTALALTCVPTSLYILYRNLPKRQFWKVLAFWLVSGAALTVSEWPPPHKTVPVLLRLTEAIALPAYNVPFRAMASMMTRVLFATTMTVTLVVMLAGASVLSRHHAPGLNNVQALAAKRRDLKIQLVLGSILLTYSTAFIGQWLKWPAVFISLAAKAAPKTGDTAAILTQAAEQVQAFAEGARLYFGAGYSLALLAAAILAVLSLSRRLRLAQAQAKADNAAAEPDPAEFMNQNIFARDEIATLLAMIAPFLAGAIGFVAKI